MSEAVKYTFSENFDAPASLSRKEEALKKREEELQAIRKEAYDEGFNDGHAKALEGIEASSQETLTSITKSLENFRTQHAQYENNIAKEAAHLAYNISLTLTRELMQRHPYEEVESIVTEGLHLCLGEPRIVIHLNDQVLDILKDRLENMVTQSAYTGQLVLVADANLGQTDCLVEWPNGGIERNVSDLNGDIQSLIERYLDTASITENPPDNQISDDEDNDVENHEGNKGNRGTEGNAEADTDAATDNDEHSDVIATDESDKIEDKDASHSEEIEPQNTLKEDLNVKNETTTDKDNNTDKDNDEVQNLEVKAPSIDPQSIERGS